MNHKHKCFVIISVIVSVIVVLVAIFLGNLNRILLRRMMHKLENAISTQTHIIDKVSVHGKLNGNGNGIQYFGAVLVADFPEEEIAEVVEALSEHYEEVGYAKQQGNEINSKYLEHRTLRFSVSSFTQNKEYYIIYFFNSNHPQSWPFDLAGH